MTKWRWIGAGFIIGVIIGALFWEQSLYFFIRGVMLPLLSVGVVLPGQLEVQSILFSGLVFALLAVALYYARERGFVRFPNTNGSAPKPLKVGENAAPPTCPKCGQPVRPGARFCGRCGQALTATPPPFISPSSPPAPVSPSPQAATTRVAKSIWRILGMGLLIYLLGAAGVIFLERTVAARPAAKPVVHVPSNLPRTPRQAGQAGLDWLLNNAVTWQNNRNCYGCHVQSFAVLGAAVAQANAYVVDTGQANQLASYLAAQQDAQGIIQSPGVGAPLLQTTLAGMGLGEYNANISLANSATLVKIADWLATQQTDAGNWGIDHKEPPVAQGEALTTGAALITLAAAQKQRNDANVAAAIQRGVAWLRRLNPATTQDIVFALLGLKAGGVADTDPLIGRLIDMLKTQQNSDGGWGETTDLGSSSYATGQALYAYKRAGVPLVEASFQQGVLWLLQHQQPDGIWPEINSQQTNGSRASNYASTMWAVIGLGEIFNPETEATFLSLIHPEAKAASGLVGLLLFLLLPALVVGAVWWQRQGRQWPQLGRIQR